MCPAVWLQTLMDACCLASDFSIQGVAISLVMDLVGLTQSVAMVTAEGSIAGGNPDSTQPMSPSQGRVAVVIRPPLTQGILKYIAEKTDFFKVSCREEICGLFASDMVEMFRGGSVQRTQNVAQHDKWKKLLISSPLLTMVNGRN